MVIRNDKLNKETLAQIIYEHSGEVYDALLYAYNNTDKPKSIGLRMEKVLTKIQDKSQDLNTEQHVKRSNNKKNGDNKEKEKSK